jgi:hypothetical protein
LHKIALCTIDYASGEFRASPARCWVFVKLDDEVPPNAGLVWLRKIAQVAAAAGKKEHHSCAPAEGV